MNRKQQIDTLRASVWKYIYQNGEKFYKGYSIDNPYQAVQSHRYTSFYILMS